MSATEQCPERVHTLLGDVVCRLGNMLLGLRKALLDLL